MLNSMEKDSVLKNNFNYRINRVLIIIFIIFFILSISETYYVHMIKKDYMIYYDAESIPEQENFFQILSNTLK